jgi:hypothetical protein
MLKKILIMSMITCMSVFLIPALAFAGAPLEWQFNKDGDSEGWEPSKGRFAEFAVKGGSLTAEVAHKDPYFVRGGNEFDASTHKYLILNVKNETNGKVIGVFWGTKDNPGFAGARTKNFNVEQSKAFKQYVVDMSEHKEWKGTITDLRLDIPNNVPSAEGKFAIDYIVFSDKPELKAKEAPKPAPSAPAANPKTGDAGLMPYLLLAFISGVVLLSARKLRKQN